MRISFLHRPVRLSLLVGALCLAFGQASAERVTILHVGDQESWLLSAQGNLRDNASQAVSFYGGIDRLATVMSQAQAAATAAGSSVIKLNAGDAFLPGPRWNASKVNLANSFSDGGQDFYDAIAMRRIGFDAAVFGNHEFDEGPGTAARFAEVSGTKYLSSNLNFSSNSRFNLNPAVERARVGCDAVRWQGAPTKWADAHKEKQRRQRAVAQLNRVGSTVT